VCVNTKHTTNPSLAFFILWVLTVADVPEAVERELGDPLLDKNREELHSGDVLEENKKTKGEGNALGNNRVGFYVFSVYTAA